MSKLTVYKISPNVLKEKDYSPINFVQNYSRAVVGSSAKEIINRTLLSAVCGSINYINSFVDFIDTKYITSVEEVNKYSFKPNEQFDADSTYILHPLCPNVLIEKSYFFKCIIDEQINEIISYVTSAFSIDEMTIKVLNSNCQSADLSIKAEDVSGAVGFNKKSKYLCSVEIGKTPKSDIAFNRVWINNMPILVNAVNRKSDNVNIKQEVDNSFGINLSFANAIGLNLNALKHCCFEISYSVTKHCDENNDIGVQKDET